jgi:hypothetical protein
VPVPSEGQLGEAPSQVMGSASSPRRSPCVWAVLHWPAAALTSHRSGADFAQLLAGGTAAASLWAVIGVAVGAIVWNQVGAVVGLVVRQLLTHV